MRRWRFKIAASFFLGVLTLPAWAAKAGQPGSVNYIEGQVSINGQPVDTESIGSLALQPGQSLSTGNGKAEILLTPGVLLRVDDASSIEMVSASLTNTEVKLDQGRAIQRKSPHRMSRRQGGRAMVVRFFFECETAHIFRACLDYG